MFDHPMIDINQADGRLSSTASLTLHYPTSGILLMYNHSHQGSSPLSAWRSTCTDVWRVYEDVCMMCASLWMGVWKNTSTPVLAGLL